MEVEMETIEIIVKLCEEDGCVVYTVQNRRFTEVHSFREFSHIFFKVVNL